MKIAKATRRGTNGIRAFEGKSKMKKERVNRPRHTTTKGTFKNY